MQLIASQGFEPYIPGGGPYFGLVLWDTGRRDEYGKFIFKYNLTMTMPTPVFGDVVRASEPITLFEGEDFHAHYTPDHPQGLHNLSSVIENIMGFLTLRPGDTDEDYFKNYSELQLEYCNKYAESLSAEVSTRFGDW